MENLPIAEMYYSKLQEPDSKPIPVLVAMCKSLFDMNVDDRFYAMMGKLVNVYGVKLVYFGILDCVDVENLDTNNIIKLISYFTKKRFENKFTYHQTVDLNKRAREIEKSLEKKNESRLITTTRKNS